MLTLAVPARPDDKRQEILRTVDAVVAQGPFRASWESLQAYQVPEWYKDAKFGIFIHWGVYSVPAFDNEWYPRNMYLPDNPVFKHHVATYGPQSQFGYKDFISKFRADKFDAHHWAELFRKAGAKYVVPVAEHHDGFPMYECSLTEWSAAKLGPKRDVVGELAAAIRKEGMHFGASTHRAEHWWFFNGGMTFDSDVRDPRFAGLYGPAQPDKTQPDQAYLDDWLARTAELVEKYQPEVLWFDWWIEQPVFQPYLQRFAAYYYNRGAQWKRGVAINYKLKSFPERAAVLDIERGQLDTLRPLFWQTDTSVSEKSWGYIADDKFRTPDSLVDELVDIVSKNGCLLLNVGPKPDGTIPAEVEKILLEMGQWLATNGEAIYGTRPWKVYGEGPIGGWRFLQRHGQQTFHCAGHPLYDQRRHALCRRAGLAGDRPADHQVAGSGLVTHEARNQESGTPGLAGEIEVDAQRGWSDYRTASPETLRLRLRRQDFAGGARARAGAVATARPACRELSSLIRQRTYGMKSMPWLRS
jgi:alpha-L-fucosidase